MRSDEKFWLQFWRIAAPVVIVLIASFPVYHIHRDRVHLQMIQAGATVAEIECLGRSHRDTGRALMCRDIFMNRKDHDQEIEEVR